MCVQQLAGSSPIPGEAIAVFRLGFIVVEDLETNNQHEMEGKHILCQQKTMWLLFGNGLLSRIAADTEAVCYYMLCYVLAQIDMERETEMG